MIKKIITALLFVGAFVFSASAQVEPDIQSYLERIYQGDVENVRKELPTLIGRYQSHPGVIYLQGMLTTDGPEAVKVFQSIVDNFPESEWADDALYRVYQYYYSVGLYRTAEQKLNQLKKEYPESRYAFGQQPRAQQQEEIIEGAIETAPQTEVQKPEQKAPPVKEEKVAQPYALQVGAFSTYENAMRQRDMLSGLQEPIEISTRMQGGQTLYLVWVGSFDSRDRAGELSQKLRKDFNIDAIIISR